MANNRINIIIAAKDEAGKVVRGLSKDLDNASGAGDRFRAAMGFATKFAVAGAVAVQGGLIAAAKASYDQVKAVEEARFGLQAYEKDATKVEKVLGDLVAYARSDMGVLFNRKDMFAAASTLKLYGNETDTLTERVKILSKGVANGKTTFQELSTIVGRAAAKGRLDAVDFDMLIERGIGLDRKFRGAKVSADELYKALDSALPAELLKGRAETIEGRMIRMQSAFRGVGDQVLGVDSATSNFIEGGLGDRFQKAVGSATDLLKRAAPVVGDVTRRMLRLGDRIGAELQPVVRDISSAISKDFMGALNAVIRSPFARIIGTTFVMALKVAGSTLAGFIRETSNFVTQLSGATGILVGLTAGVVGYNVVVGTITGATRAWAAAQALLNTAMRLNPVGLVIGATVGIVAAYAAAVSQTDRNTAASDRLNAARDRLRSATDAAREAEDRLKGAQLDAEGASLRVEEAQRSYNNALKEYGPDSLEARRAAYDLKRAQDDLATANKNVRDRAKEAVNAQKEIVKAKDAIVQANQQIAGSTGGVSGGLQNIAENANRARNELANLNKAGGVGSPTQGLKAAGIPTMNVPGRSIGTNYAPGGATWVGEHGPELMNVPRGSQISPAWQSRSQASQNASGGVTNILSGTFTFQTAEAVQSFFDRLDKTQRLAKLGVAS